jgi:hypothetical protein
MGDATRRGASHGKRKRSNATREMQRGEATCHGEKTSMPGSCLYGAPGGLVLSLFCTLMASSMLSAVSLMPSSREENRSVLAVHSTIT